MTKRNKKSSSSIEERRKKRNNAISNPFEIRVTRLKHNVIGKKLKTDKGVPGVARSKANEKRKKTLLKEYKQRFKANQIVDKRFGEFDHTLSVEEKMLKRFTLEKQRHHEKSGLYNMDDDDDEQLTHYGQSLADMDNFDDAGLRLTDDEDGGDNEDHFGGFQKKKTVTDQFTEVDDERKLTKQEIMDQIVANSKKKKYERQQIQEQAFELTQKLDSQWKEIQSLLVKRDDRKSTKFEKPDDYDKVVNELIFEAKAQATDKLKTEEQIAREEKEKLEQLEKDKRLRMLGITNEDEDENSGHHISADALIERKSKKHDDRFEIRYADGKMVLPEGIKDLVDPEIEKESDDNNEDDDEEDDEEDDGGSGDDDDDAETDNEDIFSEDDNTSTDNNEGKNAEFKIEKETKNKDSKDDKKQKPTAEMKATEELPFIYHVPNDLKDFLEITKRRNHEEILTALQRIKKCHHMKVDAKNEAKLEKLFDIVLDYIDHLCDEKNPPLKFIEQVASFTFDLIGDVIQHATKSFQTKLKRVFEGMTTRFKIKGNSGMFPILKELILFRVIALNFPTSDLNHVVTTPCLTLMAMILSKGHLTNMKDVISSIFLLNIIYDYVKLSRRYVPEVICFFAKLLYQAADPKKKINKISTSVLNLRKGEHSFLLIEKEWKPDPVAINLSRSLSTSYDADTLLDDSVRISCIHNVLHLVKKFSKLYEDLESFCEIFQPCALLLKRLPIETYPNTLKSLHDEVTIVINSRQKKEKRPLTLQARKPVPLPLFEPEFDENYEIRPKRRAGDKKQNELEKLKYKFQKETKAAAREIRKDAHFLAKEELKETLERDATRRRKVKELQKALETERREIKEMEKASKKF